MQNNQYNPYNPNTPNGQNFNNQNCNGYVNQNQNYNSQPGCNNYQGYNNQNYNNTNCNNQNYNNMNNYSQDYNGYNNQNYNSQNYSGYNNQNYNGYNNQRYSIYDNPDYYNFNRQEKLNPEYNERIKYQQQRNAMMFELKRKQKSELLSAGFSLGMGIIICLVIQVFTSLGLNAANLSTEYASNPILYYTFNPLAVSILAIALPFGIIALINKKHFVTPIIPHEKIGTKTTLLWSGIGIMGCIVTNMIVGIMIDTVEGFGYDLTTPNSPPINSVLSCILLFIATVIMPAICEEFSMRCCALGLLRKHGFAFSVFAVSIIFGLLHGNLIQFVFAFIIGFILAFVTVKTESIIPAMIIHALNNGRSVVYDITEYAFDSDVADTVTVVLTVILMIWGIIATINLVKNKQLNFDSKRRDDDVLSFGSKIACLLPGLALPLLILIANTISTIVKA